MIQETTEEKKKEMIVILAVVQDMINGDLVIIVELLEKNHASTK